MAKGLSPAHAALSAQLGRQQMQEQQRQSRHEYLAYQQRQQSEFNGFSYDATACYYSTVATYGAGLGGTCEGMVYGFEAPISDEERKELRKKELKAENKALLLLQNIIGSEQCDVYRKTHRIVTKPSNFFWIIGDMFNNFKEDKPFYGKPDVIRIDNEKKLHITSFCVDQVGDRTPYTDKVITFATHLINDEKAFVKTINRISESTLKKIDECALMGG